METPRSQYPDISEILERKAAGRRQRASLSFAEKLDVLDALKARIEPVVQARKARAERKAKSALQS
jgi:hypothetical protein